MTTNIEENKALVLRFFAAIENNRLEEFDSIVAINYDDHLPGQSPGREVLKKYFSGLHAVFKYLKLPIHAIIAEGDKVAVYNSVQGVHNGDYGSFKAKGNLVDAKAFQLYRIENGQFAEHWEVADFITLVTQIQA
ncbi:ester cyclase [Flavihumibacter solisilvae]|nr:ester cyclase [Flavihumibacter solisilvae]